MEPVNQLDQTPTKKDSHLPDTLLGTKEVAAGRSEAKTPASPTKSFARSPGKASGTPGILNRRGELDVK